MRKFTIISFIIWGIIALSIQISFGTTNKAFLLAGEVEPPLKWINETGNIVGIEIDILTEILREMKDIIPSYKFVLYESSAKVKREAEVGHIDQYITLSFKPEREKHFIYPKQSHMRQTYYFFVTKTFLEEEKAKGKPVKFETYSDLKDYLIGATKDYAYVPEFWEAIKIGILKADIVIKNELNIKKLITGRINLFPSNGIQMMWEAKKNGYLDQITYLPKPIKDTEYYNPFSKASVYPGVQNGIIVKKYDEILSN
ncbi:MAG: ABC transporter substrate-binding protein [Desulfobacterales bacterium]|nr:ABC transporter substrate-binding protein [Desulfobacterales bacterium]